MKRKRFQVVYLFCLLIALSNCSNQNKESYDLSEFSTYLKSEQAEFQRQYKAVKEQYPLVALAFEMQQASLIEVSNQESTFGGSTAITASEPITIFTGTGLVVNREAIIELQLCFDGLWRDLGRSKTYEEGLGAFDRFNRCRNRDDRVDPN